MTTHPAGKQIREEADRILRSGLMDLLEQFGEVHVVGSYALDLMTWRDLDIHVVRETLSVEPFFQLGGRLALLLKPHRMHFRDELRVRTPGLPEGLYWGIYLGDERAGAWKIDIWLTDHDGFERTRAYGDRIAKRLTPDTRAAILSIKEACWNHPEYRRTFTSADVYAAVLDRGIRNAGEFWADLGRNRE